MDAILSIKPKYCEEIINGGKKYEFRKKIFQQGEKIENVFMYSTSPVKKIVGIFKIDTIIEDTPKNLWDKLKRHSGVDNEKFFKYFNNCEKGYAIRIKEVKKIKPIDPTTLITNFHPPRSFSYILKSIPCRSTQYTYTKPITSDSS